MGKFFIRIFGVLVFIFSLYVFRDTNIFKVNRVNLTTNKLPKQTKLRILQITDIHNKRAFCVHQRLVNEVRTLSPDIIVLTGDVIDRRTKQFHHMFAFLECLATLDIPVYYVTGNHECENPGREEFLRGLKKRNIRMLEDEHVEIPLGAGEFTLIGVHHTPFEQEDVSRVFQQVNRKTYTILLSHSPDIIMRGADLSADLILSGHTHGGQIRLPIFGAVVFPREGLLPELDKGLIQWGKDKYIYVDSGLGTTFLPIRFLNQSQISLIEIEVDN